jgi:hypothetical protein
MCDVLIDIHMFSSQLHADYKHIILNLKVLLSSLHPRDIVFGRTKMICLKPQALSKLKATWVFFTKMFILALLPQKGSHYSENFL